MTDEIRVRARHELAADGVLITSGLFAFASAIALPILWLVSDKTLAEGTLLTGGTEVFANLLSIAMLSTAVIGPWLTWTLHGRKLDWKVVLAAVASMPLATAAAGVVLPMLSWALHPVVAVFSDAEYAAPMAVGVLAGVVYCVVVGRAVRATFFEYGGPVALIRAHQAALIGIGALIAELVVGIGLLEVDGSMAEVLAFGMLFGAAGGVAVYAAELASGQRPLAGTKPTAA